MSRLSTPGALAIFVAEDDDDDCLLLRDAFEEAGIDSTLTFASDGQDLIGQLELQSPGETPLIILDLHMPRMDGRATLQALRRHPVYALAPIVVLSTSDDRADIDSAYALGANTYFTKPESFRGLVEFLRALGGYWRGHAQLPKAAPTAP